MYQIDFTIIYLYFSRLPAVFLLTSQIEIMKTREQLGFPIVDLFNCRLFSITGSRYHQQVESRLQGSTGVRYQAYTGTMHRAIY